MPTEIETTQIKVRDNAHETTPAIWWGWPDEALLSDSTGMARTEQAQRPIEDDSEYVNLYFVS